MPQRRPSRRRGHLASLAPPALLFFLVQTAGCGGRPADPVAALALEFPAEAPSVLGAGRGFSPSAAGFAADPTEAFNDGAASGPKPRAPAEPVHVDLPWDGAGGIVFRGPRGFTARVRELGAAGAGRLVDHAVTYRREGGASFWTTTPGGVEEWLHLAGSRGPRSAGAAALPVAVWQIEGARVRARGEVMELLGADGAARVRVTAPAAYAAGGRRIDVHLRAGAEGSAGTSSIELFADGGGEPVLVDPVWKVVSPMSSPRADHRAALTGTGKVLAAGGTNGKVNSLDSAALYDAAADAWADVGPMFTAHVCHTETALTDGTVLVAGGLDQNTNPQQGAEVFDETAGWTQVDPMASTRMNHAAARIPDGRVVVTGGIGYFQGAAHRIGGVTGPTTCWDYGGGGSGSGGPGATNSVEIYDPVQQAWTVVSSMNFARERHTETLLADGKVMVAGGENYGNVQFSFETYDPGTDTWSQGQGEVSLDTSRADHTATLLPDGTVLIAGGTDGNAPAIAGAEILDPSGNVSGVATASMSTPRTHHTATLLTDGTVLVVGGTNGNASLASAEIYDPVAKTWSPAATMASARSDHSATALQSGDVLVAGGIDDTDTIIPAAELYLPLLPNGKACKGGAQCQSSFCAEGVCCDVACDNATCQACTVAKGATADGVCTSLDGITCDASPCQVSGLCFGGKCTASTPKACPPPDPCHQQGTCDPGTGTCSSVAKLDGSACTDGICIAGACVPDPSLGTGGSATSSSGTTTATTGSTTSVTGTATEGTGGSGGAAAEPGASLSGNGCATGGAPPAGGPGALALLALAVLRGLHGRKRRHG